jgi:hypothetical protein
VGSLEGLLEALRLASDEEDVVEAAFGKLLSAIDGYRQSKFDSLEGRAVFPRPAKIRAGLEKLQHALVVAQEARRTLPLAALPLLIRSYGASAGSFDGALTKLVDASIKARDRSLLLDNKPGDLGRYALAVAVASVVKHTLGQKLSVTHVDMNGPPKRGGGVYGRIMLATCVAAGLMQMDLKHMLREGRDLLREMSSEE